MIDPTARGAREAIMCVYVRTPFGRYGGLLAGLRPDAMAAHVPAASSTRNAEEEDDGGCCVCNEEVSEAS